jgi:hypothetical protein
MVMAGLLSWNPDALPAARSAQPTRYDRDVTSTAQHTTLPRSGFVLPPANPNDPISSKAVGFQVVH